MTTRPPPTRTNEDGVKDGAKDKDDDDGAALEPLSEELAARIERLVKGSKVDVDLAEPIDGDVDL